MPFYYSDQCESKDESLGNTLDNFRLSRISTYLHLKIKVNNKTRGTAVYKVHSINVVDLPFKLFNRLIPDRIRQ